MVPHKLFGLSVEPLANHMLCRFGKLEIIPIAGNHFEFEILKCLEIRLYPEYSVENHDGGRSFLKARNS